MSLTSLRKKPEKIQQEPASSVSFGQGIIKVATSSILATTMVVSAGIAGGLVGLALSFRNLPDVHILSSYVPTETSYIYDVKGKLLSRLHGEANRQVVKLDRISPQLKRAVLAIEDSNFYRHDGVNLNSIGRAVTVNFASGGVKEGASTLTMQLVKNIFLTPKRQFTRKLVESVMAIRVEQVFSKNEILEMYFNNIYWGHNSYGVETAAQSYFNKSAAELNLAESAMMAGLIQAPEAYSPISHYKAAKERQLVVLRRMEDLGWISAQEAQTARNTPLKIGKPTAWSGSSLPYVTDAIIQELNDSFGKETVLKGGMRIQTTVDYSMQKMAEASIQRSYQALRGKGLSAKDLQVALVAIDPRTHFIKAIVGGVDYDKSQLNRVTQSRRQPGSSFKPFVYYTAFASGKFTPSSVIVDGPVQYRDGSGWYRPKNYGGSYSGAMSIRHALSVSQNVPAVIVGQKVGIDKVIEICRRLGFHSPLPPVVSLPLGSVDVTPLEMAGAYATFASNGWHSEPTMIVRVTDSRGNVLLDNTPKPQLILDPWATASLTSVLQGVINSGTGKAAALGRPAAGKTGTTDNERNVWFVGYVPQLAAAVWVGNDSNRALGKGITGGHYAAPIWRNFMAQALKDEPVLQFPNPAKFPRPKVK